MKGIMNCRTIRVSLCIVSVLVLAPALAAVAGAQDQARVGITMGFPTAIGVIIHATDKVAVRPDFSFSTSTSEGPTTSSSDGWAVGAGVSALFYVATHDHLRTYVSPRLSYSKFSSTSTSSISTPATTFTSTATNSAWGGAGSFGAQYAPTPKFSVFGEVGFGYSHQSGRSTISSGLGVPPTEVKGHGWGTRAGVGVVFYP